MAPSPAGQGEEAAAEDWEPDQRKGKLEAALHSIKIEEHLLGQWQKDLPSRKVR